MRVAKFVAVLLIVACLIFLAISRTHAEGSLRLTIEYRSPGVVASITMPCDWARIIVFSRERRMIVWGRGPGPHSAFEAMGRGSGSRMDGWTNATLRRPNRRTVPIRTV